MNAPTADGSAQVLSGDLQLLIPAWRLNDTGFVYLWQAIVQGNASNSAIEFQIFEPNSQKNGVSAYQARNITNYNYTLFCVLTILYWYISTYVLMPRWCLVLKFFNIILSNP